MKKTQRCMAWMLLLSIMLAAMPSVSAKAAAKPKTMAHAYYVMDAKSGEKILSDRANKKIYPASTVKLLTALTVLDYADVNQTIKFTRKLQKKIPSDASALNLKTGRRYTVKQYLNMLLIVSDAGSALALAEGTAGNVETFVEYMNDKAEELGMKHSHFDNPVGLDKGSGYNGTYTTAADFIKVSKAAMENPLIAKIVAKHKYKVQPIGVNKSFVIKNTNAFYGTYKKLVRNRKYKIIGSKTGTTRAAGHCLVATAVDEEGNTVICAFYGNGGYERLYKDIRKLLDYAFARY
jgi:D-alanyl-D-alanine carboxypeptidase (penicillin-binding protein 5/6)